VDDKGTIARLAARIVRDAPVWIVVLSIAFLILVNLRRTGLAP
jgi:hypothetical protein